LKASVSEVPVIDDTEESKIRIEEEFTGGE
jgi:hypothetical protein